MRGLKLNVKFTLLITGILLVPISVFSIYIFHNMENNSISEKENSVRYFLNQSYERILKNVDSINISTQFFLSDQKLKDYLVAQKREVAYTAQELMEFTNADVVALERMVNNNPYLYQIRVYADNPKMQEIMPILYRMERMERLEWAQDENAAGWKFDYTDQLFESFRMYQNQKIMALVTPIEDYLWGEIGMLEVAMRMDTMFPMLYEEEEGEWNFFIDGSGKAYHKEDVEEKVEKYLVNMLDGMDMDEQGQMIREQQLHGEFCVIGSLYVKELDGYLLCIRSMKSEMSRIAGIRARFLLLIGVFLIILIFIINYIVHRMLKQFYMILHSIRQVQKGDMNVVIEDCGKDEMGELGSQINIMLARLKRLMEDNLNRELLVKNSEIRALQNQINAHFIYNVLESIKMMAEIDEKYEISDAITALGKLLRYSMKWTSGNVTVEQEIDYIHNYLALINLRFDYEIYLSLNIPENIMIQEIPKMSLQPIVENSIYHGIEQMAKDTNIYIKGFQEGEDCIIEITDAGKGMSEEEVRRLYQKISGEIDSAGGSGNGIGLKNVQDRIRISFGPEYGLEFSSKPGMYTKVRVRVPMNKVSNNVLREGNYENSVDRGR